MKLSDLVGGLGLSAYPIVGLVLFLGVFIAVLIRVNSRRAARGLDHAAMLPLDDTPLADQARSAIRPEIRP